MPAVKCLLGERECEHGEKEGKLIRVLLEFERKVEKYKQRLDHKEQRAEVTFENVWFGFERRNR